MQVFASEPFYSPKLLVMRTIMYVSKQLFNNKVEAYINFRHKKYVLQPNVYPQLFMNFFLILYENKKFVVQVLRLTVYTREELTFSSPSINSDKLLA